MKTIIDYCKHKNYKLELIYENERIVTMIYDANEEQLLHIEVPNKIITYDLFIELIKTSIPDFYPRSKINEQQRNSHYCQT